MRLVPRGVFLSTIMIMSALSGLGTTGMKKIESIYLGVWVNKVLHTYTPMELYVMKKVRRKFNKIAEQH